MQKLQRIAQDLLAGMISSLLLMVIAITVTALIFNGPLLIYFPIGLTCAIIGSSLINFISASFSKFTYNIARAEPAVGAVLAIIIAKIASDSPESTTLIPTLLATFALASISIGLTIYLLGLFKGTQTARYIPYPVLGGIITGVAWIMIKSGLLLIIHDVNQISWLMHGYRLPQLFIAISFVVILLIATRSNDRLWIMPTLVILGSIAINTIIYFNIPVERAIQEDWIFPSIASQLNSSFFNVLSVNNIDWLSIVKQWGYFGSLIFVAIAILALNISALETFSGRKADIEYEFKLNGIANILSGILFSIPGNLSLTGSVLNKNLGARTRLAGITASIFSIIIFFIFPNIFIFISKPIIVGLLIFIAAKILIEWLYDGIKTLPISDYAIMVSILICVSIWGLLIGFIVGLVITCLFFIIRYARTEVIRFSTTGTEYRSNVIRTVHQEKLLAKEGYAIQIFKLQGYLFFGSIKLLLDKITQLIENDKIKKIKYIILDFQYVTGIDSSASYNFIRLHQYTKSKDIILIFTECSTRIFSLLTKQHVVDDGIDGILVMGTLDQGLEWCEDEIIKTDREKTIGNFVPISNIVSEILGTSHQEILLKKLEKISIPQKKYLFKQNDDSDCLYFIESGQVSTFIEDHYSTIRIAKSGSGTVVGEIGFYLKVKRSASVYTDTDCIVYKLSRESLSELEKTHPEVALSFHRGIINLLAIRLIRTNNALQLVSSENYTGDEQIS